MSTIELLEKVYDRAMEQIPSKEGLVFYLGPAHIQAFDSHVQGVATYRNETGGRSFRGIPIEEKEGVTGVILTHRDNIPGLR